MRSWGGLDSGDWEPRDDQLLRLERGGISGLTPMFGNPNQGWVNVTARELGCGTAAFSLWPPWGRPH